jgi:hypothetical protein
VRTLPRRPTGRSAGTGTTPPMSQTFSEEGTMYSKRMQQIRRTMHQRRVHEAQRQIQVAAEREQMRATIHAHVR